MTYTEIFAPLRRWWISRLTSAKVWRAVTYVDRWYSDQTKRGELDSLGNCKKAVTEYGGMTILDEDALDLHMERLCNKNV